MSQFNRLIDNSGQYYNHGSEITQTNFARIMRQLICRKTEKIKAVSPRKTIPLTSNENYCGRTTLIEYTSNKFVITIESYSPSGTESLFLFLGGRIYNVAAIVDSTVTIEAGIESDLYADLAKAELYKTIQMGDSIDGTLWKSSYNYPTICYYNDWINTNAEKINDPKSYTAVPENWTKLNQSTGIGSTVAKGQYALSFHTGLLMDGELSRYAPNTVNIDVWDASSSEQKFRLSVSLGLYEGLNYNKIGKINSKAYSHDTKITYPIRNVIVDSKYSSNQYSIDEMFGEGFIPPKELYNFRLDTEIDISLYFIDANPYTIKKHWYESFDKETNILSNDYTNSWDTSSNYVTIEEDYISFENAVGEVQNIEIIKMQSGLSYEFRYHIESIIGNGGNITVSLTSSIPSVVDLIIANNLPIITDDAEGVYHSVVIDFNGEEDFDGIIIKSSLTSGNGFKLIGLGIFPSKIISVLPTFGMSNHIYNYNYNKVNYYGGLIPSYMGLPRQRLFDFSEEENVCILIPAKKNYEMLQEYTSSHISSVEITPLENNISFDFRNTLIAEEGDVNDYPSVSDIYFLNNSSLKKNKITNIQINSFYVENKALLDETPGSDRAIYRFAQSNIEEYSTHTLVLGASIDGNIGEDDTSILLSSVTDMPITGTIYVDGEAIHYTGISTNTITGITRGIKSTLARAHTDGTPFYVEELIESIYIGMLEGIIDFDETSPITINLASNIETIPSSGYITFISNNGKTEILSYSSVDISTGTAIISAITRGQRGTVPINHDSSEVFINDTMSVGEGLRNTDSFVDYEGKYVSKISLPYSQYNEEFPKNRSRIYSVEVKWTL